MFFVSAKRYDELVGKNEALSKENMALRYKEVREIEKAIEKSEEAIKLIEELQTERDRYKNLYLDELQKRLELADMIQRRWG